ncbi:2-hydroxycarboxylate transporter family protein [Variovorax ureilyticus]|uniref:2-hydroxycarboxylate transporter family protein n=1 Tax=Variovorax ureilyticus TaxID=1836198 RepID=A0ABU8VGQ0_9BURK
MIPLPVYIVLIISIGGFIALGKMPTEMSVVLSIMAVVAYTLVEIGRRTPVLRNIGGAAILVTFVPAFLVYKGWLPEQLVKPVVDFFKSTNIMYMSIACIIVGSIFGMDRSALIKGFLKILVPLASGTVVGAIVGTAVGSALGLGAFNSLFFIVVPIMAGGVGEGAIPLALGYSDILHQPQGDLLVRALPAVMVGNLSAILFAGMLAFIGRKFPHLTGNGRIQPGEHDEMDAHSEGMPANMDLTHIAAAGITAISFYVLGLLCYQLFGAPAPVVMIIGAAVVKLTHAVSPKLQEGSYVIYKFFTGVVALPVLFAFSAALLSWEKLLEGFAIPNLVTIVATVFAIMTTGFVVARWVKLYPIDAAVVNLTHSGMGGAGDIAILSACDRMQLMPFAQIATRIGGAIVVVVALFSMGRMI